MKHIVRQTVRFGEVDAAGIVYYPRFFDFFHIAFEEFFSNCVGVPYDQLIGQQRLGFPAVRVECDFDTPLHHGEQIDVEMTIHRIGRSSFTSAYRVLRAGQLCARALITTTTVDLEKMEAIPIPDRYREVLERYRDSPEP
jgi:4-hydroxybenzoyl-CoA thioesterase